MVVQGASDMLVQVGSLLAAAGVVVAALAFGGRAMSPSWAWLSYAIAIGFVVVGVLSVADVPGDVSQWLTVLLTGILVPVWAFWLASRSVSRMRPRDQRRWSRRHRCPPDVRPSGEPRGDFGYTLARTRAISSAG